MFLGTPGALRERQIKKLHKTKSDQHQIILGITFMKMLKFQNFGNTPGQPCLLWVENQNSAPNIFFALSSCFRKGMTQPPCPKTLGGDRFGRNGGFWGLGLTPRAPGSKLHAKKLLAGCP